MGFESNADFLQAVLTILPEELDCYFWAPDLESQRFDKLVFGKGPFHSILIKMTTTSKQEFIDLIQTEDCCDDFHAVQIKIGEQLLFEAYDGTEFGILSKNVVVPEWFISKYVIPGDCAIAAEW